MTFHALLIHTLTVFNPVDSHDPDDADRYGNEPEGFDTGTTVIGRVDERSSSEQDIDQDSRNKQYLVFFEPSVTITALSKLTWNGHELRVDGEPLMKYDGKGPHHFEVECLELLG